MEEHRLRELQKELKELETVEDLEVCNEDNILESRSEGCARVPRFMDVRIGE